MNFQKKFALLLFSLLLELAHPYVDEPIVYLTVSSIPTRRGVDRLLELNWERVRHLEGSQILLHGSESIDGEPLFSVTPTEPDGYVRTSVRFPEQTFSKENLTDACLGYRISYTRNDERIASSCIRARPNWMFESRSIIGNRSLVDLMIPGTHNTGSYRAFDREEDTLLNRYLFTQEEDLWSQLVYGIRYLDLRVAHRRSTDSEERFWITHSSFKTDITLREVFRQVRAFLNSTQEIVVMDFHRFVTGFQNRRSPSPRRRHRELVAMLEQELGEWMIPKHYTSEATLNQLWDTNKRLYVGYADERARSHSRYLFPAIKHLWGDVDQVQGLRLFLNETVCDATRRRMNAAMAQLTPTTAGVLFNVYGGLRKMADQVNREVTKWFRHEWNHCANIVATDFFHGNDIIDLSIETNIKRFGSKA